MFRNNYASYDMYRPALIFTCSMDSVLHMASIIMK